MKKNLKAIVLLLLLFFSSYGFANVHFSIISLSNNIKLKVTDAKHGNLRIQGVLVGAGGSYVIPRGTSVMASASHTHGKTNISFVISYTLYPNKNETQCHFNVEAGTGVSMEESTPPLGCVLGDSRYEGTSIMIGN